MTSTRLLGHRLYRFATIIKSANPTSPAASALMTGHGTSAAEEAPDLACARSASDSMVASPVGKGVSHGLDLDGVRVDDRDDPDRFAGRQFVTGRDREVFDGAVLQHQEHLARAGPRAGYAQVHGAAAPDRAADA